MPPMDCALFDTPDLRAVGALANPERERRHAGRTYFNYNIRVEATNVCVASCLFCSFARLKPGDEGAYTLSLEQAWDKLRARAPQPLTEVHVVNGLHPDLPFSYYKDLLRGFKRLRPGIHLKCFTAVEIAFFADLYGMTDEQVLRELMAAASVRCRAAARRFCRARAAKICHDKGDAGRLPCIHRTAHRHGHAHQRDHALRPHRDARGAGRPHAAARALQDETGGFQAFIPLAFHPDNKQMRKLPPPSGRRHAARARNRATHARQHPAREGLLDRHGRRVARRRCGSASTISTAPSRKRASTTWPARRAGGHDARSSSGS